MNVPDTSSNELTCRFCKLPIAQGEQRSIATGGYGHEYEAWCIRASVYERKRLQDRCAEFEANLTIAERQVTEARVALHEIADRAVEGQYDGWCKKIALAALSAGTSAVETTVTPDFAAGFERGIVKTVLKEVEALTQGRTDAFWSGVSTAIDETTHRLEEAWNNLPVKASAQHKLTCPALHGAACNCGQNGSGDAK